MNIIIFPTSLYSHDNALIERNISILYFFIKFHQDYPISYVSLIPTIHIDQGYYKELCHLPNCVAVLNTTPKLQLEVPNFILIALIRRDFTIGHSCCKSGKGG